MSNPLYYKQLCQSCKKYLLQVWFFGSGEVCRKCAKTSKEVVTEEEA